MRALHRLVHECRVVAGLKHGQPQVGRIDAALAGLHEAMQESRRGDPLGIGRLARLRPSPDRPPGRATSVPWRGLAMSASMTCLNCGRSRRLVRSLAV